MSDGPLTRALLGQVDWWWNSTFRPRIADLGDDEYRWEPAAGAWSIRDAGDGLVHYDYHWPPPKYPPVTTIAWRMCHIGVGCLAVRTSTYFPDVVDEPWTRQPWEGPLAFPLAAQDAIVFLDNWWEQWRAGLRSVGDDGLWRPMGPGENAPDMQLGADDPLIGLVLHIHRELMHHGAEINLLRDLYRSDVPRHPLLEAVLSGDGDRARQLVASEPHLADELLLDEPAMVLRAAETGRADAVRLAVELGFDIDAVERITALHHAVAGGDLALTQVLIELGADLAVTDSTWHLTPLGWARHFDQQALVAYLSPLTVTS